MIIAMRRYLKGPVFKAVLWLTLLSVAGFWGIPTMFRQASRSSSQGAMIASVNGQQIGQQEFSRITRIQEEFLHKIKSQYGRYADFFIAAFGLSNDPKNLALEILIRQALLDQEAEALKLSISQGYFDYKIENPEFLQRQLSQLMPLDIFEQDGSLNPAALSHYMAREKISEQELNAMIKDALARDTVLDFVKLASYAPQFALRDQYQHDYVKKSYEVMTINYDSIVKKELATPVADAELKKYFDEHNRSSKDYWTPEVRSGVRWTFKAYEYGLTTDDKEIEDYYQDYKGQKFISVPLQLQVRTILFKNSDPTTMEKARKLREELIQSPTLFALRARELSEDAQTAKNDGLIPFFAKGTKDKAFERAAFLLKQDGDISDPVTTSRGIELIQRVARKSPEYKPLSEVKDQIKEQLIERKFKEQFGDALYGLLEQGKEEEFKKFVADHHAVQSSVEGNETQRKSDKAVNALFGIATQGEMSSFFESGAAVVVRLDSLKKKEIPALETVKERVLQDYHHMKATKTFKKMVSDAAIKALTTPISVIAKEIGAQVEIVNGINSLDTQAQEALRKKNIPVELLFTLEKVGSVGSHIQADHGYVARVQDVEKIDEKDYQARKQELGKKVQDLSGKYFVNGFVASLYRNATIKTSESMVNTTQEDDYTPIEDYL